MSCWLWVSILFRISFITHWMATLLDWGTFWIDALDNLFFYMLVTHWTEAPLGWSTFWIGTSEYLFFSGFGLWVPRKAVRLSGSRLMVLVFYYWTFCLLALGIVNGRLAVENQNRKQLLPETLRLYWESKNHTQWRRTGGLKAPIQRCFHSMSSNKHILNRMQTDYSNISPF